MPPDPAPAASFFEYLGRGYNVATGDYASVNSLLGYTLEVTDKDVRQTQDPHGEQVTISGSSAEEYAKGLATHAGMEGSYGSFSGSISATFESAESGSLSTAFCSTWAPQTLYRLDLVRDSAGLQELATADFRTDCAKTPFDPFAFFRKWGTHYVHGATIGGRYVCGFTTRTQSTSEAADFKAALTAKYASGLASVDAQGDIEITSSKTKTTYEAKLKVTTYGGKNNPVDFKSWSETVSANATLMDFPSGGLVPISELCTNPENAKLLAAALPEYLRPPLQLTVFSATGQKANHPTVDLVVPTGFKILGGGAGVEIARDNAAFLTSSYPVGLTEWHADAKDHLVAFESALTASVVAIYDPLDALEVLITTVTSPNPAGHPFASVSAPDGYALTGGGAQVKWSGAGNLLFGSFPGYGAHEGVDLDHPPAQPPWTGEAKDHIKSSGATITVYAIGVRIKDARRYARFPLGALSSVITSVESSPAEHPEATVAADGQLVGGGARDNWDLPNGAAPGNMLTASYPKGTNWHAQGASSQESSPASLTVYAIGLKGLPDSPRVRTM